MLRAEKWKATSEGTWEKSWVCVNVGEGREEGVGPKEHSPCHSKLTGPLAIRKLCFPVHPPTPHHPYIHDGPGAACHLGGLASIIAGSLPPQGLSMPWHACLLEGLHPCGAAPNTASPWEKACSPEKLEQAWPGSEKVCLILGQSFQVGLPWGRASWIRSSPASCSIPCGVPHSYRTAPQDCQLLQETPHPRKARISLARL